jgi:hypothetical protein
MTGGCIKPATRGFSGPAFFHKNNGLAPEWLFLQPRKINRLNRFSRTNPSEICAYFTISASREKHASKYADLRSGAVSAFAAPLSDLARSLGCQSLAGEPSLLALALCPLTVGL